MKLFTVSEANQILGDVRPILKRIKSLSEKVREFRKSSSAASNSAQYGGGGVEGGSHYVSLVFKLASHTDKLNDMGIQLKDYSRGLIDFPSERDGRIVLLCWQLGEGDKIEWWHDIEAGFGGRRPL